MNIAKRTHQFLTFIAWGVGIESSWRKIARFCANAKPNTSTKSLDSCQITNVSPIADAQPIAYGNQGSSKKMNNKLTAAQRRHLAAVKELPCGVCGAEGPSDAHHIEQGLQYTCIPLCKDCHQGSFNGIHGQRRIWNVLKKTEMTVLNDTIEKLTR